MWAGIKYFLGNLFRCVLLVVILVVLVTYSESVDDISNSFLWVFFVGGYYSVCIGSFTIGDYKVSIIENGFSFGLAFALYFVAYSIAKFIISHVAIFFGLAILFFAINRGIETFKFWDYVPAFFKVTSIISVVALIVSTILSFASNIEAGFGILIFVLVLELLNFSARSFQAADALDY